MKNSKIIVFMSMMLLLAVGTTESFGQRKYPIKKKPAKQPTLSQTLPNPSTPVERETKGGNTFTSIEGRFSVTMPDGFPDFTKNSDSATTPDGQFITVTTLDSKFKNQTGANECIITYVDLPIRNSSLISPSQLLESVQRNILAQLPAPKVLKTETFRWSPLTGLRIPFQTSSYISRDDSLDEMLGYQSRSILIQVKDILGIHYLRIEAFPIKSRVYSVTFFYPNKKALDEKSEQSFFASFRVSPGS